MQSWFPFSIRVGLNGRRLYRARMAAMTGSVTEAQKPLSSFSGVQQVLIKPVAPETLREVVGGV